MALFTCPECGKSISDKAEKCPHCGYPVSKGKETLHEEHFTEKDAEKNRNSSPNKKSAFSKKLLLLTLIPIVLLIIAVTIWNLKPSLSVGEIEIGKWRLLKSDYLDEYEGTIISDEKKPFIAIIGEKSTDDAEFVYMENGMGQLVVGVNDDEDPSKEYSVIGYLPGEALEESNVTIQSKDGDYSDYKYLDNSTCSIDVEITYYKKETGVLFFELHNDVNGDIKYNCCVPIVDGEGKTSYYVDNLPYKMRGVKAILIPKLFCKARLLSENDYTIVQEYSAESSGAKYYQSYNGKEIIALNGIENGLVLYSEKLYAGGMNEYRGEIRNMLSSCKDGTCSFITYDYSFSDEKLLKPAYSFRLIGYIPWKVLGA